MLVRHRPAVELVSTQIGVRNRIATLKLFCPAGETFCDGRLRVYHGRALLGRAHLHIRGGKIATIRVRLGASALRRLAGSKTAPVTVVVIARDRAGRMATTRTTATLVLG
jgi:hypothetical protein